MWLNVRCYSLMCGMMMVLAGCGGPQGPQKVRVDGTVTLNGQPVPSGQVVLHDPAMQDAAYAGPIEAGKFSFETTPGKKTVSITSPQEVHGMAGARGGIEGDPVSPENPAVVIQELIPARYNDRSELTIEVTLEGKNQFPFELSSK